MNPLQIPDEFTPPDYGGSTIANIPATIASLLKVPFDGLPSLYNSFWDSINPNTNRIVLILLDSFGWGLFQQEHNNLSWLVNHAANISKITSVFPSTTVAALSSLWTGYAPAQHGLVGLKIFFPEQAVLGQLLSFSPIFGRFPDSLIEAGLNPEKFLEVPGFAEQLESAGIPTYAFKGRNIVYSPLSQMHDRGVAEEYGVVTSADLFVQIRELLETRTGSLFVSAYWPAIDTLSHLQGPNSRSVKAELHTIMAQIKMELFESLSPAAKRGTTIFITGDHGQIISPPSENILLDEDGDLKKLLLFTPAGEPRTPYLFAKQGEKGNLIAYLREKYNREMFVLDSLEALDSGLLGPPEHCMKAAQRIGDILVTMRSGYLLLDKNDHENYSHFIGRHGGMTPAEMEVPLIVIQP